MSMIETIRLVKQKFRDEYGFKPDRVDGNEPLFDRIPDGDYPMILDGTHHIIRIKNNRIIITEAVS